MGGAPTSLLILSYYDNATASKGNRKKPDRGARHREQASSGKWSRFGLKGTRATTGAAFGDQRAELS